VVGTAARLSLATTEAALADLVSETRRRAGTRRNSSFPAACRAGCAHCCHIRVDVTAAEVFTLKHWIDTHVEGAAHEALRARVDRAATAAAGVTEAEYARRRLACPLLVDGACGVYAARPLDCEAYVSADAGACENAFDAYAFRALPLDFAGYAVFEKARRDLDAAAQSLGRQGGVWELSGALAAVLGQPQAFRRWQAGEKVFA